MLLRARGCEPGREVILKQRSGREERSTIAGVGLGLRWDFLEEVLEGPALDAAFLNELRTEVRRLRSPWHSDHLCFSTAGDRVLHELMPLKFCRENVTRVA